ncbi:MAG: beta-glucoside-specific PTS transporter subunit IIABC [Lachnospiraceae bacterium]
MSKEYESLARKIVEYVGGTENVNDVYHCQTRLRFKLADESKADQEKLEALDGVSKVMLGGGVYQVIIGTHVKYVFEEVEKIVGPGKKESSAEETKEKKSIPGMIIDFIAGTFQPVIPALSGAGMVKALLALLIVFKVISTDSQTYYILNFFADGVFYFLPIMLAFTEAQKLRCNPILAASVAAIMLHPNWGALVAAGEPVHLFGVVPLKLTLYTSSVIPIILVILVQAYVERWLEKHIPNAVKLVFVPMLTFLIMGTLGLAVLGPAGSVVGDYLAVFFNFLSENASWAPAVIVGGFLPIMVMFGLHNGVAPLGVMQMADLGYDSIFGPGCVCSNIAQGTAALVVALRTKEAKTRQLSISGGITALMGITEPILYGVNLPKKYPLVAAMIGGGCGGLFAGLTHTHRFATGSSGLPAILLYIGDDSLECFINIIIALIITVIVTAVVTYVLSLKYEGKAVEKEIVQPEVHEAVPVEKDEIKAPVEGNLIPLKQIGDGVFSEGVLGQGCGIEPEEGCVYAPFNGTVESVADTGHAVGLTSEDGIELLIHVGLDTVALQGEGFTPLVKEGDSVFCGQRILNFDKDKIAEKYPVVTAVIVTNSDDYADISMSAAGKVNRTDTVLRVKN